MQSFEILCEKTKNRSGLSMRVYRRNSNFYVLLMVLVCGVCTVLTSDLCAQPVVERGVVDWVAASVEFEESTISGYPVLGSEVELAARFDLARAERNVSGQWRGEIDESAWRVVATLVSAEVFAMRESARLVDRLPTTEQLDDEMQRADRELSSVGGVRGLLAAMRLPGVTESDVRSMLRRRWVVRRFLQIHAARVIDPTDAEMHNAYEGEIGRSAREMGRPLLAVQEQIRDELARIALPRAVMAYLRTHGTRVRVEIRGVGSN